jgi:diguanylate cyclase (GGDEF)-like protein
VALLAVVLFSVIATLSQEKSDTLHPKAVNGNLNLSAFNFSKYRSLPLEGDWEFYWQKLVAPVYVNESEASEDFLNILAQDKQPTYAKVPHVWLDLPSEDEQTKTKGFASYKLNVKVAQEINTLALRIPTIGSAYRLYIDDKLISSAGQVSADEETSQPGYNLEIVEFEVPNPSFVITVEVSNYDLVWGGIWQSLRLGKPGNLHLEQSFSNFKATFIIATFLTIATFNLVQFSLRTIDATPLIIATICLLLGLREVEASGLLSYLGVYRLSFDMHVAISFLSFYICAGLFMAYYAFSFKAEYKPAVVKTIYALATIYTLSALLLSPYIFTRFTMSYQIICIGIIGYIVWGLAKAVKRKRPSANIILLGTVVLFSLMLHDILMHLRFIDSTSLVNLGLVGLIMCKNFAIYTRFITALKQNRYLNTELEEQNSKLEKFSKSLEDLVDSRTQELSNANEKLEILAFNDSLTGALNRRGLLQEVELAKQRKLTSAKPFCFLLIDFDHFKRLNDTLGHEAGDVVLVEGAKQIKSVISEKARLGRWGGEEFLILLNDTAIDDAKDIAQGVRVVIFELLSAKIGTKVSISIGAAEFHGSESIEKTINRADEALYRAKSAGRNRVELALPHDAVSTAS